MRAVQGVSTPGRFQYDADGRRSLKIGEEGPRQYVYDQTSVLAEYDAGGLQKAKYDYGSDRLISLTRPGGEGRRYFSLDGLRSVVNLTDDQGSAVASYHLDAWGNFRFPNELDASRNRFAFTGHIFDTETGLYQAKARYFDPKLGRFLSQDSVPGQIDRPPSLHRYVYASDNPTTRIDLTGFSDADANELAKALGATGIYGVNRAANRIAAPVTRRLEGVSNLVAPVSYVRNPKGEGASLTRQRQYQLLDQALDSRNSVSARLAAGAGVVALQPGAVLNDVAHGLASVPGELKEAYSHAGRAVQAESWLGAFSEGTQALEETMGAAETTIGSILLIRGGAKVVQESRSAARTKTAPVTQRVEMPTDMYDQAAWAAYWEANPGAVRSVGAAGTKGVRLRTVPEEPGVYHIEAAGEKYTGSAVDVRARLRSTEHPAADLMEDPGAQITVYPADIGPSLGDRTATNRALRVVEQDVMNEQGNVPKTGGSRNQKRAITEKKHEPYRQQYEPKLGDPQEY